MDLRTAQSNTTELQQFIQQCIDGNNRSRRLLYDEFEGDVMAICIRYLKNRELAEDTFQEAFIRIFQKIHTYDHHKGPLIAWIYRLVSNVAIRQWQKKKLAYSDINDDSFEFNTETSVELPDNLELEFLKSLINKLPEGQRIVFNMYIIEGYTHKEISEILGNSEVASRAQLARAKSKLMEMYQESTKINSTFE